MKQSSFIFTLLTLMLPIQSIMADDYPKEPAMTLRDCLIYAREHAHSNRLNRLETDIAKANRRLSASDLMPYIGLGSNGSLSFGRNIDPETNTYDNKKTLSTGFGIEMSLPLFDGLVRINNLKALKAAELRKQKTQLIEEDRISLEVIKDFYNISYCISIVEQMQRQLQRDSTDLEAARLSHRLGTKSGAEVAELEAIVAADHYELINQQNLLKKAYLSLRTAMGMPESDNHLNIAPDFGYLPTSDEIRILPEIEEAHMAVKEDAMYLRAAKGGYSPKISFSAGVSTSYFRMMGMKTEVPTFSRQFRDNMGEYFSLSFSLPIFDGFATANRVKKASLQLQESRIRLEQTQYQLNQAAEEARLDYEAAIEELTAATLRLDAEQIAYTAMRKKYELGAASAIDLYTSSSKLAIAEANIVGKRIQRVISEITYKYYLGHPLIND